MSSSKYNEDLENEILRLYEHWRSSSRWGATNTSARSSTCTRWAGTSSNWGDTGSGGSGGGKGSSSGRAGVDGDGPVKSYCQQSSLNDVDVPRK